MLYVTLEYIVERLINNQILSQATKTMEGRKLEIAAKGKVIDGMCSPDPMNVVYLDDQKVTGNYADPDNKKLGKHFDPKGDGPKAFENGELNAKNIMFNKDFVIEAYDEAKVKIEIEKDIQKSAGGKNRTNGISLQAFFDVLFKKVEETSGGWWQLALSESPEDSKILQIVNTNQGSGGIEPLQFDPINGDAVTRSTSISCTPDKNKVYQAMCNQQKEATTPNEIENAGEDVEEEEPVVTHEQAKEILKNHRKETAPGGFDKGLVKEMTNALNTLINTIPKEDLKESANIPYPLIFKVKLDGTSGFRFGDIVTSTAIPDEITALDIVFRVNVVTHTIENNDWVTELTTMCDIG